MFEVEKFWVKGFIGVNVKMVVFDIGVCVDYFYFCNIKVVLVYMIFCFF